MERNCAPPQKKKKTNEVVKDERWKNWSPPKIKEADTKDNILDDAEEPYDTPPPSDDEEEDSEEEDDSPPTKQ